MVYCDGGEKALLIGADADGMAMAAVGAKVAGGTDGIAYNDALDGGDTVAFVTPASDEDMGAEAAAAFGAPGAGAAGVVEAAEASGRDHVVCCVL